MLVNPSIDTNIDLDRSIYAEQSMMNPQPMLEGAEPMASFNAECLTSLGALEAFSSRYLGPWTSDGGEFWFFDTWTGEWLDPR